MSHKMKEVCVREREKKGGVGGKDMERRGIIAMKEERDGCKQRRETGEDSVQSYPISA